MSTTTTTTLKNNPINRSNVQHLPRPITASVRASDNSFSSQSISVYVLRCADPTENWKIQAIFSEDLTFEFKKDNFLASRGVDVSQNDQHPLLYHCPLEVHVNNSGEILFNRRQQNHKIDGYRLRISKPGITGSSFYEENRTHSLINCPSIQHHFLFSTHFETGFVSSAPGNNVAFLDHLCIFTYFILKMQFYNMFNSLFEQFTIAMKHKAEISFKHWNQFFQKCFDYYHTIKHRVQEDVVALRILISMIAPLSINREILKTRSEAAMFFASMTLSKLSDKLDTVLTKTSETEWSLFQKGLVTLICIELTDQVSKPMTDNIIILLSTIRDETKRQDTALKLLDVLSDLRCRLLENEGNNLLKLVDRDLLTMNHLEVAASIETYIIYATYLVTTYQNNNNQLAEDVSNYLNKLLQQNHFPIHLSDIAYVLNYLKIQTSNTDNDIDSIVIRRIQSIFETNSKLQSTTKQYLEKNNYHFSLNDFALIRDIIFRSYNPHLLCNIDRQHFLLRTLGRREDRKSDYFLGWFKYFLCESNPHWMNYQELLEQWTACFVDDREMFSDIVKHIDHLIELWTKVEPNNNERSNFFVQYMIKQCFQQTNMFRLLMRDLCTIKNKGFLNAFKQKFKQDQLTSLKKHLKEFHNPQNILLLLIEIDKEQNGKNKLVKSLIASAAPMILIGDDELVRDTFINPSHHSCVYAILFHESFNSLIIRREIIKRLAAHFNEWRRQGIHQKDLRIWKDFSSEKLALVHKIWILVDQVTKSSYELEKLFDKSYQDMEIKWLKINNILKCLDFYCQTGSDIDMYKTQAENCWKRFKHEPVRSIEIPQILRNIVSFAEQLNPYYMASAWQAFLRRKMAIKIGTMDHVEQQVNESHEICFNTQIQIMSIPCLDILKYAVHILADFKLILQRMCPDQVTIHHIVSIFPNIQQAEKDLELFESLPTPVQLSFLRLVVSFWKNRPHINHICMGLMKLSSKIPFPIDVSLLTDVCNINETTLGGKCASIYEQYHNKYENPFPVDSLTLISYYDPSLDLFVFLHSLTTDDVYHLQEAVNDWDETLVNTKTIFDFSTVKNFLDRFYAAIDMKRQELANVPLELEHIIECFKNVKKSEQFNDLFKCLDSSSLALPSIKRIHLELTNKEQSKRRQIADILQQSTINFCRIGNHESTFDVNVELPNQQTVIDIEKKKRMITFIDLSDLCDQARLLEYSSNINKHDVMKLDRERDIKKVSNFVHMVGIIESTLETLVKLYTTGHPYVAQMMSSQIISSFSCTDGVYHDLIENNTKLTSLFNEWDSTLCTMYKTHIDLTYFCGNQFWLVEDYIYNRSSFTHSGYHLLKFIDIDPNLIEQPITCSQKLEDRLINLGDLLLKQRPVSSSQEENPEIKKIYVISTTNEGILRAILSLFSLMQTSATVHQIFYCTPRTNWIQVRAFIYRCFYSQIFHQLIRPELLSQSIQDQFIRLLRSFIEQKSRQKFRLGIITTMTITNQQLINEFQSMQIVKIFYDHELLDKTQIQEYINRLVGNCKLVTSRITGLGKSSTIRHEVGLSGKNYIKFPICSDFDPDSLAERLQLKFSDLRTSAIHFDIGFTENDQQLNEILYCLLLFRSFRFGQVAVSIPADTPIFIELDASFQSTLPEVTLFQYLHSRVHLLYVDWTKLNVDKDEIQLVANYLQAIASESIANQDINSDTFKKLDLETCVRLIQHVFIQNKDKDYITWTQLSIFISVFNHLFSSFSRCGYFFVEHVPQENLRMDLVRTLLQSSNQFTSVSVEAVRKQQRSVTISEYLPFSDAIVRWDKIQPFTFVFTNTDYPLFVYKRLADVPPTLIEYFKLYYRAARQGRRVMEKSIFPNYTDLNHADFFIKLASLSQKYLNKSICRQCFRQYDFLQQICQNEKCSTKVPLNRPKSLEQKDIETFQLDIAKQLQNEYVLTPDNYIKMLLIYMRVQSGIPILIMGETGCGKTALIQCLCEKILDSELKVFHIHAGVTAEQIIKTMECYIIQAQEYETQKRSLWIFFDEFNTTNNITLIKEIICERTLLGESLPHNMTFLGACNPHRQKTKKIEINDDAQIGLRKKRYEVQELLRTGTDQRLLYTVVPIPETMLEYIWDYGHLNETIEMTYIKTMLNSCQDLSSDKILFDLTVELLTESHNHFRDLEDASSVSLRDIARFRRFYNWFLISLKQRANGKDTEQRSYGLAFRASLIALMLCYYFRSRSGKTKQIYIDKMQLILVKYFSNLKAKPEFLIKEILQFEQRMLIDKRMELPPGTAANRALRNNIFVLFACIFNHIPLILCGKPGSSKSSAVQIITSNLRGKKSSDLYFQTLPELVTVSFQGSQNCTSESIIKVFECAKKYSQVKDLSELLPVIVFDEIGLAELSPHNPLKALHAELEVENCQFGFVGISNWRLDAAKMNRALYLSTPDPDVEDLYLTGMTLWKSIQQQCENSMIVLEQNILKSLAEAYYNLRENLTDTQPDQENYFGLRDYYSLIKCIARDSMTTNEEINIYEIIRKQLTVNFDGVLDGSTLMWQQFCQSINKQYLFDEFVYPKFDILLDRALNARSGRYLLLIADHESTIDYAERYIRSHQQKQRIAVCTLIGSSFPGDLLSGNIYAEQYNYRVLMDIILYAETPVTLIMRQMGHLYDNLYDLFNQNFVVSARKTYCRIALGALYHPRCLVHDDFYCIVFIHKRDLDQCDPPFLNRFEKHLIDIQTLIHPQHWSFYIRLYNWLDNLLPKTFGKHFPLLQHLFVDYSEDRLCNLVIEAFEQLNIQIDSEENDTENQTVINYCQTKLMRTSSFDLPLILSLQSTVENENLIQQYFDIHQSITFRKLLETSLQQHEISPQIIYTYTQIFQTITHQLLIDVEEIKLSAFKTELELKKKIKSHYQTSSNIRLLLIRINYHDEHQHILSLKYILLNEHLPSSGRGVWLIFHLQRNLLNQITNDILFSGWSIDMINDLNDCEIISKDILNNFSYRDLIIRLKYPFQLLSDELVYRCLSKFRYIISPMNDERRINKRLNEHFRQITLYQHDLISNNLHLHSIIDSNVMKLIKEVQPSDSTRFVNWRLDLLTNSVIVGASRTIHDAFQAAIGSFYEIYLFLLLTHFEKYYFIDSYVYLSNINDNNDRREYLSKLWLNCLTSTLETIDLTIMNLNIIEIPLVFDLRLPCATIEYDNIRSIRDKYHQMKFNNNNPSSDNLLDEMHRSMSVYGENFIQLIVTDPFYFQLYFHDQLAIHLNETNIKLSSKFAYELWTMNPIRTFKDHIQLFLIECVEFTEILRLFEIGTQFIDEFELLDKIRKQIIVDSTDHITPSTLYTCVLIENQCYQLPPGVTQIEDQWIFQCQGDPTIEISVMNLIELILCSSVINRANNIQQISTAYSLISQGIRDLPSYLINNLEKLRSFISLVRCLTALFSTNALAVFKDICTKGFDAKFDTCSSIHNFIGNLRERVKRTVDVDRILIKLEIELLKNWLADNSDSYGEILSLINEKNNNLWLYSAKIFTFIDRKLNLVTILKENHGEFPLNEDYEKFNQSLDILNNDKNKIEQLMVNRFHMCLMLKANEDEINQQLIEYYPYFVENFYKFQRINQPTGGELISYLSWLKYYAQIYGFALNNNRQINILDDIDRLLTNNETPFGSTLKLFIFKQVLHMSKLSLNDLRDVYMNINIQWIKPFLQRSWNRQTQNVRRNFILPTPIFECKEEFKRVNNIFSEENQNHQWDRIIEECSINQRLSYACFCWFIQHYCSISLSNVTFDTIIRQFIENDDNKELICSSFTPLGHRFLISLCSNFSDQSYFHLHVTMSSDEIHQRLLALNIVAVFISFKSLPNITLLGNMLFDEQRRMPDSYIEHFSTLCIPGLIVSNPIITQMKNIRTEIQEYRDRSKILDDKKFIIQCSEKCLWIVLFQNYGISNYQNVCPLCKKPIGAERHNILIARDPPQIRMTIDEGLQKINQYIYGYDETVRFGYYSVKSADESCMNEKPDHLNRPISFRFIHFLIHGLLLFLHDQNYLSDNDLKKSFNVTTKTHFYVHFKKDYNLLIETSPNKQQCYIWLYKLLNHLINDEFAEQGLMNTNQSIIKIEQLIEEKLIFAHIDSIFNEIDEYKLNYIQLVQGYNTEPTLEYFIEELFKDEQKYPYLEFFNVTKFHTVNPLDEFILKIATIPYAEHKYPITTFLLKKFNDYMNIQYLYPIVVFTNYLINKFNHRLTRREGAEKKVVHYLTTGNDEDTMKQFYEKFLEGWYSLTLDEVHYGCQTWKFDLSVSKEEFAEKINIGMLLLSTSKDKENLFFVACLITIAQLQNEIVNYFHNSIDHFPKTMCKHVSLQSIRPENILRLDQNILSKKLIDDSLVLNYHYGKGNDVIYDYEEIELTFQNMISSLVMIDIDQLRCLNYQLELYGENVSFINDVRIRIKQEHLTNDERTKLSNFIGLMDNDDMLNYLDSLSYIFTYLRNDAVDNLIGNITIQKFVEKYIRTNACLNDNIHRQTQFSKIELRYIIDLYEMIEESVFDKILSVYMKKELLEETFTNVERQRIFNVFSTATFEKETIAETLKNRDCWISMLKRLITRVLNANVSLDMPLQLYLKRTDLWIDRVSDLDLATFHVDENISLKHVYVILRGLEKDQSSNHGSQRRQNSSEIQSVNLQQEKAKTWFSQTMQPINTPKLIPIKNEKGKNKIRV